MKTQENNSKKKSKYNPLVPAVDQAMQILAHLGNAETPRLRLTEICRDLDIHRSKTYTILNTLIKHGIVDKDPQSKTYALSMGVLTLARRFLDNLDLREVVRPYLVRLAQETSASAHYAMIDGDYVYVVAKQEATNQIGVSLPMGSKWHITHAAHGKAIAAFSGEEARQRMIDHPDASFYGPRKALDRERLRRDLEHIRQVGYGADDGEATYKGIKALSAPVYGSSKRMVGCLIVLGMWEPEMVDRYGRSTAAAAADVTRESGAVLEAVFDH